MSCDGAHPVYVCDHIHRNNLYRSHGHKQEPWQADLLLPSLFLSAATLILVMQNPVHVSYQPRLVETLAVTFAGIALMGWGTLRGKLAPVLWGAGVLLGTIALGLATQPPQLGVGTAPVWPLRTALVLLVAAAWAFLAPAAVGAPRHGGCADPTTLGLICVGGPALAGQVLGQRQFYPNPYFSPYWLAVDSRGTLYASNSQGGAVYVFDASGMPRGTLNPTVVTGAGTPGPGIVPIGLLAPLSLPGSSVIPTATPFTTTITADLQPIYTYCGLAVDPNDNLYLMDLVDPNNRAILRFNRDGVITARWPAPATFEPTRGCIAADANHVYLSSLYGQIFALDGDGKVTRELKVDFQPFGMAPDGDGDLMVIGPTVLNQLNLDTGEIISSTLPRPPACCRYPTRRWPSPAKGAS